MSKRSPKLYLDDILIALQKIEQYTEGVSSVQFRADSKTVDARVYAIGLYVSQRSTDPHVLLGDRGTKRMRIVALRDVAAEAFADALVEGVTRNHTAATMQALKPQLDAFGRSLLGLKEVKKGAVVNLDYVPGSGVRLLVNDDQKGSDVPGTELYPALLRVWIGDRPAQSDLKEAVLGKSQTAAPASP